jgi:hypothetical protein
MSVDTEVDEFVRWNLIMSITAIITESYVWNTYCLFNLHVQTVENSDIYKNTAVYDRTWHVANLFELQDKKKHFKGNSFRTFDVYRQYFTYTLFTYEFHSALT